MSDGRLDLELRIRKGKAEGRFTQFEKIWATKHVSLATKVREVLRGICDTANSAVGSECWSFIDQKAIADA